MKTILIAIVVSMLLIACGSEKDEKPQSSSTVSIPSVLSGTYVSENGKHTLVFTADRKVKTTQFGKPVETTYTLEGKTLKYHFPGGVPVTSIINEDGSITSETTGTKFVESK